MPSIPATGGRRDPGQGDHPVAPGHQGRDYALALGPMVFPVLILVGPWLLALVG